MTTAVKQRRRHRVLVKQVKAVMLPPPIAVPVQGQK